MNNGRKLVTILGASGSIGVQTLDVISKLDLFEINYLTVNSRTDILELQIAEFNPRGVVITDEKAYKDFRKSNSFKGEILFGNEGLIQAASDTDNDLLVSALVGFSGLIPTLEAIKNGINVALANKETLVAAGKIFTKLAKEKNVKIFPIDSEHNALLQCIVGEDIESVEKMILTASGGPFINTPIEHFEKLTVNEALNHPNWKMGSKITIDSATMMNKGFEVIEAHWLYDISVADIEVVVHPQSIVHSLVQFTDGSVKAQLGMPDMRIPISYALTFPKRLKYDFPRLNLSEISRLDFYQPDNIKFRCLDLAYNALRISGNAPAVLNAANEITVDAFLNNHIGFNDIALINQTMLDKIDFVNEPSIDDIVFSDVETRIKTKELVTNKR